MTQTDTEKALDVRAEMPSYPMDFETHGKWAKKYQEELCDALATQSKLESGEYVLVQGWQSIETAPKDGTRVLVSIDSNRVGRYEDVAHWAFYGDEVDGAWFCGGYKQTPTHWMPIPDTAMIAAQEGGE